MAKSIVEYRTHITFLESARLYGKGDRNLLKQYTHIVNGSTKGPGSAVSRASDSLFPPQGPNGCKRCQPL